MHPLVKNIKMYMMHGQIYKKGGSPFRKDGKYMGLNLGTCQKILDYLGTPDYIITEVYESSFKAIRQNEWMLSERNVSVTVLNLSKINECNVFNYVSVADHVLHRFK